MNEEVAKQIIPRINMLWQGVKGSGDETPVAGTVLAMTMTDEEYAEFIITGLQNDEAAGLALITTVADRLVSWGLDPEVFDNA